MILESADLHVSSEVVVIQTADLPVTSQMIVESTDLPALVLRGTG